MKRALIALTSFAVSFFLVSCGGGGGGTGTATSQTIVVDVPQGGTTQTIDNLTLNVPPGAMPGGGTIRLVKYDNPVELPPNKSGTIQSAQYDILSDQPLAQSVNLSMRAAGNGVAVIVGKVDDKWQVLSPENNSQTVTANIAVTDRTRSIGSLINRVTLIVFDQPDPYIDPTVKLVPLAGQGSLEAGRFCVLDPGIVSNYMSQKPLAESLVAANVYKNAYGLKYDWRLSGDQVAQGLKAELEKLGLPSKSVDLIGHSKGGLNNTYMLNWLGASKYVATNITIDSPHSGPCVDSLAGLLPYLRTYLILGSAVSDIRVNIPMIDNPAVMDMAKNSEFMQRVWNGSGSPRYVDNLFVTNTKDYIVYPDSGLAESVNTASTMLGRTERLPFTLMTLNSHSALISDPTGIDDVVQAIANFKRGSKNVSLACPDQLDGDYYAGWAYNVSIQNNTGYTISLSELIFDTYNKDESSVGSQWYDPNTPDNNFFPNHQVIWGDTLAAGGSRSLDVTCWFDYSKNNFDATSPNNRAKTAIVTLIYKIAGSSKSITRRVTMHYGNIWPSDPVTRSPQTHQEGGVQLISPGKK